MSKPAGPSGPWALKLYQSLAFFKIYYSYFIFEVCNVSFLPKTPQKSLHQLGLKVYLIFYQSLLQANCIVCLVVVHNLSNIGKLISYFVWVCFHSKTIWRIVIILFMNLSITYAANYSFCIRIPKANFNFLTAASKALGIWFQWLTICTPNELFKTMMH